MNEPGSTSPFPRPRSDSSDPRRSTFDREEKAFSCRTPRRNSNKVAPDFFASWIRGTVSYMPMIVIVSSGWGGKGRGGGGGLLIIDITKGPCWGRKRGRSRGRERHRYMDNPLCACVIKLLAVTCIIKYTVCIISYIHQNQAENKTKQNKRTTPQQQQCYYSHEPMAACRVGSTVDV